MIHARNAGAYGFFEAYGSVGGAPVDMHTRAALFQHAGARTPLFARFSTVSHGGHGPETVRDPRGFSIRFHTDDGRWDFIGSSLPVDFVRDPTLLPSVAYAFRPEPVTHRLNPQRIFDFIRFTPSALNMVTWLFSPWGIPANYRSMCGFGAGVWVNTRGERAHVRYHLVPVDGPRNLVQTEADALQSRNFNHATQDLYEAISRGAAPAWEMGVQLIGEHDAGRCDFDPLDPTVTWPLHELPIRPVGRVVLDRNPRNYFAEVEQVVFRPGAVVDGLMRAETSSAGRAAQPERTRADELLQLTAGRAATDAHDGGQVPAGRPRPRAMRAAADANHRHAGHSYRRFAAFEQDELVRNLVAALRECDGSVQAHMVEHLRACDVDYGRRVAAGLGRLH